MKKARISHDGVRVGDMRHRVMVQVRAIKSPTYDGAALDVDFGLEFTDVPVWTAIKVLRGKTVFDNTGKEIDATHEILLRKMDGIEEGNYVQLVDGTRLRVIQTLDYGERGEYMALTCSHRGLTEAAKA